MEKELTTEELRKLIKELFIRIEELEKLTKHLRPQ